MPLYQTKKDTDNERQFKDKLSKLSKRLSIIETEIEHPFDFIVGFDGVPILVAEYKRRYNNKDTYPDYQLDYAKVKGLVDEVHGIDLDALIFVRWNNGTFFHVVSDDIKSYKTGFMRRRNMRDANDEDKTVIIELSDFKHMSEFKEYVKQLLLKLNIYQYETTETI